MDLIALFCSPVLNVSDQSPLASPVRNQRQETHAIPGVKAQIKKVIPELTLPAFSSQPHKCQQMGEQLLATRRRGWMMSVHQADPPKLGAEQLSQLSEYIDQQSRLAIGDDCRCTDIQTYIEREFGVAYELSNVYRLLRELGFS